MPISHGFLGDVMKLAPNLAPPVPGERGNYLVEGGIFGKVNVVTVIAHKIEVTTNDVKITLGEGGFERIDLAVGTIRIIASREVDSVDVYAGSIPLFEGKFRNLALHRGGK